MKIKPHRPYELKEYDSSWTNKFKALSKIVKKILKKEILEIYHVGSTSIKGMVAKPQTDILVVVKDIAKIKHYRDNIISEGFIYLGNYVGNGEDCFALDELGGKRLATIHIVEQGNPEIYDQLAFREYLKSHKKVRDEYSCLKKELYKKYKDDYSSYGPGKKEFIVSTLKKARLWAQNRNLGPHIPHLPLS